MSTNPQLADWLQLVWNALSEEDMSKRDAILEEAKNLLPPSNGKMPESTTGNDWPAHTFPASRPQSETKQ